jgi:excisionase family DNA binding protein
MKKNDEVHRLLKIPEVASILSISRAMAYNLVQTGEIRSVHIRSSRRVRVKDLQEYIEFNLQPSEGR